MKQTGNYASRATRPMKDRFNEKVLVTPGCWYWMGDKGLKGYGRMSMRTDGKRKTVQAHRLSYEMHIGPIPVGMCVCHRCDTPRCVNPDHLWIGTNQQNVDDKMRKGRWRGSTHAGEDSPVSKLKNEDIYSIRADDRPISEIARKFGVWQGVIFAIKKRRSWVHLPPRGDERESVDGRRRRILSEEQCKSILSDSRSHKAIAADLGISAALVGKVKLGWGCYARDHEI